MSTSQFDIIRHQAEASVRNRVSGAQARLRRETSLVGLANQWGMELSRQAENLARPRGRHTKAQRAGDARPMKSAPIRPAQDGYLRRSPVQPVMVPRAYRRQLAMHVLRIAGLVVLIAVGVYLLMRSGLVAF